jgi:hypothetical protein
LVHGYFKLHRYLLNFPKDMEVDHINGNTLDNRRENLRICTSRQNTYNMGSRKNSSSKYKGVSFMNNCKRWRACAHKQIDKYTTIYKRGTFDTEKEAATKYNEWAIELFGEFARLNDIGD